MIGVVVATHGDLGQALVSTLNMILGESAVETVALKPEDSKEAFVKELETALQRVDPDGKGALVLVDLLGGTPFNAALEISQRRPLYVITGVNLPMVIKAASQNGDEAPEIFAQDVVAETRKGVLSPAPVRKG